MDHASLTAAPPADDAVSGSYHYGVIARAIKALDAAGGAPVPLTALAAELRLSPAHLQRVFSAWAGISPKRYQQYLALDTARRLLAENATTLEAATGAGLSGSGRLHDLFIRWEAMPPGVYAQRGAGLEIDWGIGDTPFGPALAMATDRGLCGLAFTAETGSDAAFDDLADRWPRARFRSDPDRLAPMLAAVCAGRGTRLHLIGPPFQIKVWEALLAIPDGAVTTYSEIARHVCSVRATRAVGTAVGRNPLAWLIPCHRVLRKDGGLGGYHWGLTVKRAMLAREAAHRERQPEAPDQP